MNAGLSLFFALTGKAISDMHSCNATKIGLKQEMNYAISCYNIMHSSRWCVNKG